MFLRTCWLRVPLALAALAAAAALALAAGPAAAGHGHDGDDHGQHGAKVFGPGREARTGAVTANGPRRGGRGRLCCP